MSFWHSRALPLSVTVLISEELPSGWSPVYSGTIGSLASNTDQLEQVMPEWLLEFLLLNKAPSPPVTKISFVLLPYAIPPDLRAVYGQTLPELLNTCVFTQLTRQSFYSKVSSQEPNEADCRPLLTREETRVSRTSSSPLLSFIVF